MFLEDTTVLKEYKYRICRALKIRSVELKDFLPLLLFLFAACSFSGCSREKAQNEGNPELKIQRFDADLYAYLLNDEQSIFSEANKLFLDEFGKNIIDIGKSDSAGFSLRLKNYFSEPTLMRLYKDEQEKMRDISAINNELTYGMELLFRNFPSLKHPRIYMHVSGLNQNVVVTDSILSLSADKYLGADYPLYQDFFYEYQRQLMTPERIVPDYLLGFMMANFLFKGNEEVLLDRILYEGKLRYILSRLIPDRKTGEFVAYNEKQYQWCISHEANIWKLILENKHLFAPDYKITEQYLKLAPYTAPLPTESPGRVGVWLGFRIISSYMKNNSDTTLEELMSFTDYNELLKKSKYKP
jgi:hypothetical protein